MIDQATDVTYATLRAHALGLPELERQLGYGRDIGLFLSKDWSVSFHKSWFGGIPCYYFVWSAIEHIFTLDGHVPTCTVSRDGMDLRARRQNTGRGPRAHQASPKGMMRRSNPAPLVLWHGAHRWDPPPLVRAAKRGRAEHGPGIYLTTSYWTARKYAKGGGAVMRFELDPDLTWLEDAIVPLDKAVEFAYSVLPTRHARAEVGSYLRVASERTEARVGKGRVAASALVNLFVNAGAATGAVGQRLALFLVAHGIHASHVTQSNEDWVVLFDPRKVLRAEQWPAARVGPTDWDLPRISRKRGG